MQFFACLESLRATESDVLTRHIKRLSESQLDLLEFGCARFQNDAPSHSRGFPCKGARMG